MDALYRRHDDRHDEAHPRTEWVRIEGTAFHESDGHPRDFARCKRGCHGAAEVLVDDEIATAALVPFDLEAAR